MTTPVVSIVIPVYNGSQFLTRTIQSLKAQELSEFEVLFIDDCSTDLSPEILHKASIEDRRFRCIQTPHNLGIVPKVMNFAREHIAGEFFVYSSQDDFFSHDWLSKMVLRARETGADAVIPDLVFDTGNHVKDRRLEGVNGDRHVVIDGRTAFSLSLDWTIPGNALWKSHLIHQFGYYDFGMYADEYTARFYFLNCKAVAFCDGVFYYYQGNANSITRAVSPKRLDYAYNDFRLYELARDRNFSVELVSSCSAKAAFSLIEALTTTFRYPELKQHRNRLDQAICCAKDPKFLDHLKVSLSGDWLRRLIIPPVIRFRPLLYGFSALKSVLGRYSK